MEKVKSKEKKEESKKEVKVSKKELKRISEHFLEKKSQGKKPKLDLEEEVLVEKLGWLYQKKKEPEKENKDKKGEEKKEKAEKIESKKESVPEKKEEKKEDKGLRRPGRFVDESSEFHSLVEPEITKAVAPVLKSPEASRDGKQTRDMEQIVAAAPSTPSGKEQNRDSAKLYDTLSDPKYYTDAYSNPSDLYEEKKSIRWGEEHVMEETRANMRPTKVRIMEEQMPHETHGGSMREGIKYDLHHQEEKHSVGFVPEFTKYNKEKRRKT